MGIGASLVWLTHIHLNGNSRCLLVSNGSRPIRSTNTSSGFVASMAYMLIQHLTSTSLGCTIVESFDLPFELIISLT